ncbi:MAG: tetratricopeptide repeat protein [Steroidobacteraceae bacterium]
MSGIFISYRRSDSPDATGRLYDCLVSAFGKAQVFKDVDSIPLGRDFRGHLNSIVGECGVLLAIMGPHWTDVRSDAGRRLEDPDDFVRIELETALARDIPVVPVLVGHAQLPLASQLPGSLASLVFRQSIEVRPDPDFHNDTARLMTALHAILDPAAQTISPKRHWKRGAILTSIVIAAVVVSAIYAFHFSEHHAERVAAEQATAPLTVKPAVPATAVIPAKSIAVLPFENLSTNKANAYFAEGISEDLLNLLTRVSQLQVTARTSSFSFKEQHFTIAEIARRLHVAHILEGSVQKAGNKVRITAQLVDVATDTAIWSQSYDRQLTDIFVIQDGIAADVVKHLKIKLLAALPTVRTTDPKAYALYLQARQIGKQQTADAWKSSNALLQQALAIDPRYAPAWNELSTNYGNEANNGVLPNDQGLRLARDAAQKALAIDPDYAPAQASLGFIAMEQNDLPGAARHFQRALALDPTRLSVLDDSAVLLLSLGHLQSAIAVNEYGVARDPVNPTFLSNLGILYLCAGRYDDAIAKWRTVLNLSPGYSGVHFLLGDALLLKGDAQAALAQIQKEKVEESRLVGLALAYHRLGQKAPSDAALTTLIAKYAKDNPYDIASVYAYRGEADPAFTWLDKAMQAADANLPLVQLDPLLGKLHSDTRWLPLLRKAGYAPEQVAKIKFTVTLP